MQRVSTSGSQEEFLCSGCGIKKKRDSFNLDSMKTQIDSKSSLDQSKQTSLFNEKTSANSELESKKEPSLRPSIDQKEISGLTVQKQLEEAKRNTEIRRTVKEITGKLNDLEIQFDRRLEELQMLVVKLTKVLDLKDD